MILLAWIEGFPLWYRMALTAIFFLVVFLQSLSIRKLIGKKFKLRKGDASIEFQEDRRKK